MCLKNYFADRAWWWQVCTEFGYFQTTSSSKQPFQNTMPLTFFQDICNNVFGIRYILHYYIHLFYFYYKTHLL